MAKKASCYPQLNTKDIIAERFVQVRLMAWAPSSSKRYSHLLIAAPEDRFRRKIPYGNDLVDSLDFSPPLC